MPMAPQKAGDLKLAMAQLQSALGRRDRKATNQIVTQLLRQRAPLGENWKSISQLMQVNGELELALQAIEAHIAVAANKPLAKYSKVVLLTQAQRLQEAHDLLKSLPEDVPDRAGRAYVLGNTALTLGHIDAGRKHLAEALKFRPGWGPAWLSLSSAVNFADDPLGEQLLAEEKTALKQGPADLARYFYAAGKLHADRKDPSAAFAAYARGAKLLAEDRRYGFEADARNAREAMSGYDSPFLQEAHRQGKSDTSRPIFVTGLPRSGTTLVEQILASHSAVQDGGELNLLQHMAVAAGGNSRAAIAQHIARGNSLESLGTLYLDLLANRFGATGRIVDKTIDASRFIGLVASALPDAPLIWMRRDPLDCAWSCFRTFFVSGAAWSFNLVDIARHFRLEDDLMAFWKDLLGDRLLIVPYSELVEAPTEWTSRILAHCGLADEEATRTPHLTKRRVATASSLQVRRPINRDGLGVAEPYRAFLKPFMDAYQL